MGAETQDGADHELTSNQRFALGALGDINPCRARVEKRGRGGTLCHDCVQRLESAWPCSWFSSPVRLRREPRHKNHTVTVETAVSLDLVGRSSRSNGSAASSRSSGIDLSVHADAARYFETRFDELGRSIFLNASYDGGWDQHPRSGSWSGVQDRSRTQTLNAQQRTRS